jgi:hypothetical protein
VSFAVKIGTLKPLASKANDREWYQKITMKQWQGISHQIDDQLPRKATNLALARVVPCDDAAPATVTLCELPSWDNALDLI